MIGWGGEIAKLTSSALSGVEGLNEVPVDHALQKLGDFFVAASGAELEDGSAGILNEGSKMQVRESAQVQICVFQEPNGLDLYPYFRLIRNAIAIAEYDDPIVELPGEVDYISLGSKGTFAAALFSVSGRKTRIV